MTPFRDSGEIAFWERATLSVVDKLIDANANAGAQTGDVAQTAVLVADLLVLERRKRLVFPATGQ